MAGIMNLGRWVLALALLALLALACIPWARPARADEPAKELTEEERCQLEKEAKELDQQAEQFKRDRNYAAATERLQKALEARRRLYPANQYPDGHPDLAENLSKLGLNLKTWGKYGQAEPYYRDALEMRRRLYPAKEFPDGHPYLAVSLNNLGFLLYLRGEYSQAEPYLRDALDMNRRLHPADKERDGHPELARSLKNLGMLLYARGDYGKAEPLFRDALDMNRRVYPADKYHDGHANLAMSINSLGVLLQKRGEYGQAEQNLRDALAMRQRLYPNGDPELARSLDNLGMMLVERGEYDKAEQNLRDALAMRQRLYPDGHPELATSINNLGVLMYARGEPDKAEPFFREALAMRQRLNPDGHPDVGVGTSLNNVGTLLWVKGDFSKAEPFLRDAVDTYRRLYPAAQYSDGHPELALSLNNLGGLLVARGAYGKAADAYAEGAAMYDRLIVAFAESGAEAEVLNLAASLPSSRSGFLAASAHTEGADPTRDYAVLWPGKAALARFLERRRRLLQVVAAADEKTRDKLAELLATREGLARAILAPTGPGDADRAQLLRDLTDRKERLEKELAGVLPASDRDTPPYTDLDRALPDGAAFLDFYRYQDLDAKTRKWTDFHYAVFVLRKGRPIRRVELTDGDAIDKDLEEWRNNVIQDFRDTAAGRLRKNLWQPVAAALGEGVDTVYVCPDGPLSALPWPALPGAEPGRVLLEEYAFAVVPSGPFLLEQLTRPADPKREAGALLAVGGVAYDRRDKLGGRWKPLPASDRERNDVVKEAKERPQISKVVERTGTEATVARLVQDLPKARWAHLATHGFFAAPESQEREHLFRPDDFLRGVGGERQGAAARNPLTLSGVVLAGANQPSGDDTGVLTGEAVAGLDLDGMDLAVLSACRTGLGEQSNGEGVFGLQRAFHIAGARNVVASLWAVDDDATAALMNLFYYHLWEKGEAPLVALHHAQLELYRNPLALSGLAKGRGAADWDETVRVVTKPPSDPQAAPKRPAAVRDWAAFVLSGAGR